MVGGTSFKHCSVRVRVPLAVQKISYALRLVVGPTADYREIGVRFPQGVLGSEG